jgi:hypothetical protein
MTKSSKKNARKDQATRVVKDLDVKPGAGSRVKGGPTAVELTKSPKVGQ